MADSLDQARAEVATVCRQLAAEGLVLGTAGNVSVRVGGMLAVTATGARFEDLDTDQVTVVDLAGQVVAGTFLPTSELLLHLGVYAARDAGAVVHTHAPMATAVGCVVEELPCVHYQMLDFGGSVPVAPYATFGSQELADGVVSCLAERSAALMANHGAVTCAGSLAKAADLTRLLEWSCGLYWRAASLGVPRVLDAAAQAGALAAARERRYGSVRPIDAQAGT
jgi:L-fuculose-phosphate aldolase